MDVQLQAVSPPAELVEVVPEVLGKVSILYSRTGSQMLLHLLLFLQTPLVIFLSAHTVAEAVPQLHSP